MVALLSLFACLTPVQKDGSGGSDSGDSGSNSGDSATIFDIREGTYVDGDTLTLTGVLVSSPLTRADADSGRSDGFFIQDPAGGANSGLYVWSQGQFGSELTVQEGDEVTVSGQISEYYDWTEFVVSDAGAITVTGSGTLPEPADLGDGTGVDWNAYESVPVKVTDQTVETIDEYNTGTLSAGVKLDDGFVYNDYSCRGHFDSVTGIVFYTYEAWSINNRDDTELSGYAEGVAIDATVHDVRTGAVCGPVHLSGVVATAPSFGSDKDRTYLFVQDPGGGEYSGIVAFNSSAYTAWDQGQTMDITGVVSSFNGLSEIDVANGTWEATGTAEPTADTITEFPADDAGWLPWQSALVTLPDVTAVSDIEYGAVLTDAGANVYVDNVFYDFDAANGTTWASVTGPLYYTSYDDVPEWLVEPRSASDLVE